MDCQYTPQPPTVVYLNSKQSIEYFPDNTGGNFTNYLPTPISVDPDSYEVALTEIFYTPERQVLTYFKNEEDRNIKIHKIGRIDKEVTVPKDSEEINDWLLTANMELESSETNVEILEEISDHGSHTVISNKNKNKIFKLPENLARALGFSTSRFEEGDHKSPNTVNTDNFKNLSDEIKLTLESENETKVLKVSEPADYTFAGLMSEIERALTNENAGVSLSVATSGTSISSTDPSVGIEFSPRMAGTFGLPSVVYTDANSYTQPTYVRWEPPPSMMYVSCDIIQPISFGSKTTSWIRVLQQSANYGQKQHLIFSPPTFHALTKTFFQTIQIQITDENDRQFNFGSEEATLTLQFREKQ